MCWAYIVGRSCSSLLKVNVNPYVILAVGALPDIDLLLGSLGIAHRGITHSLLFWSIVFIPLFVRYRKHAIPYFFALTQHIFVGDLVVNKTTIFWPFGPDLGLQFRLFSMENIALETAGLIGFLLWVNLTSERQRFFERNRRNLLSLLPMVPIAGFIIFLYQVDLPLVLQFEGNFDHMDKIAASVMKKSLFPLVLATHSILLAFLSVSFIQGTRALVKKPIRSH